MPPLPEYLLDAAQRRLLLLDALRLRGDQEVDIASRPLATVLRFDHEVLTDGRTLSRPINCSLLRIQPPAGTATDPQERPVVVVDPRAGQGPDTDVRPAPSTTPAKQAALAKEKSVQAAMAGTGGFDEALVRAVLYVAEADEAIEERSTLALNSMRQTLMHLPLAALKVMVRDQVFVLQLDGELAVEALAALVPEAEARKDLLDLVAAIAQAGAPPDAAIRERLERLRKVLPVAAAKAQLAVVPAPPRAARSGRKPKGAQ